MWRRTHLGSACRVPNEGGVVVSPPVFGEHLRLQQGEKEFLVEQFVSEATIQRFNVGVLPGRPGLDEGSAGARQAAPVSKGM